jgi:hypothetical protein
MSPLQLKPTQLVPINRASPCLRRDTVLFIFQNTTFRRVLRRMRYENIHQLWMRTDVEENVMAYFTTLSWHLCGYIDENHAGIYRAWRGVTCTENCVKFRQLIRYLSQHTCMEVTRFNLSVSFPTSYGISPSCQEV